jgi:hypothetical protein
MEQQDAYDYIKGLCKQASPYTRKINDQWDILTLLEVEKIEIALRELAEEARAIYDDLEHDNLGIITLVHELEYALQDAEDLFNEKEAKQ